MTIVVELRNSITNTFKRRFTCSTEHIVLTTVSQNVRLSPESYRSLFRKGNGNMPHIPGVGHMLASTDSGATLRTKVHFEYQYTDLRPFDQYTAACCAISTITGDWCLGM